MTEPRVAPATQHTTSLTTTKETNQVRQVLTRLNRVYPNKAPFMALLNQTATSSDMKAKKLEWGQLSEYPRYVTVQGTTAANGTEVAAGGTALFVSPANAVVPHEVIHDTRTGEDLWVVSNTSGALVVGTRGNYGEATPAAIPSGTQLKIMGAAKEEFADASNSKSITPDLLYNIPQTWERDYEYSTLARAIEYYLATGEGQPGTDAMEAMADFKHKMELTALFGDRADTTGPNSRFLGKAGGLRYWANAYDNVDDVGGALTFPTFQDIMGEHARVGGGGMYYGFAPTRVCNIMQRWALDYERVGFMSGTTKKFGLKYMKFEGTNWELMLVQHEAFEEDEVLGEQLYICQARSFRLHFMRGLGPKTHKGIQAPDNDGKHGFKDQITATGTFEMKVPETCRIIKGIAA